MALLEQLKISKWLKPAWQHQDPKKRLKALHKLDINQDNSCDIYYQVACEDLDIDVYSLAITLIRDLEQLQQLHQDTNKQALAQQQLQQLFKQANNGISNGDKIAFVRRYPDTLAITAILTTIEDDALRSALFGHIDADTALCQQLVLEDNSAKIRAQAAEKLNDETALQTVLQVCRNKDKQVYRRVKEKLEYIEIERQRPIKIRTTRDKIHKRLGYLLQANDWLHADIELDKLNQQWQQQQLREDEITDTDTQLDSHYVERLQQCHTAYQDYLIYLQLIAKKQLIFQQLQRELQQLTAESTLLSPEQNQTYQQQRQTLATQWQALPSLQTSQYKTVALEDDYQQLQLSYQKTIQNQTQQQKTYQRLQTLSEQAQNYLNDKQALQVKDIQQLEKTWTSLEQFPQPIETLATLQQHFSQQQQQLTERLEQQKKHHQQYRHQIKQQMTLLIEILEKGELQQAKQIVTKIEKLIELLPHGDKTSRQAKHQLQQQQATIKQLSGWQRWGNNLERESLCKEMENLAKATNADWSDMAKRIRTAQAEWKKLQQSDQGNQLWKRFNTACQKAYEPCDKHFKQQAEQRNQHQQQREQINTDLEKLFKETNWDNSQSIDWKGLYKQVQQQKRTWYQVGAVNHQQNHRLQEQFKTILKPWEQRFGQERKRNLNLREKLITQAEELAKQADNPDNNHKDIQNTIKTLQKQWHISVPDRRSVENKLWDRFSSACDSYFKKRRAEQKNLKQSLQDNLKAKTAICEQLENLLSDEVTEQKLDSLQAEWFAIEAVPKQAKISLEKRYQGLFEQLRNHQVSQPLNDELDNPNLKNNQWMGLEALRNKKVREQFLNNANIPKKNKD